MFCVSCTRGVMHLPAMDDGRTSGHVPAVRIDLLDQKVKEVTHLNVAVPEETRVVIPELNVVLRHFPRLEEDVRFQDFCCQVAAVFAFEFNIPSTLVFVLILRDPDPAIYVRL